MNLFCFRGRYDRISCKRILAELQCSIFQVDLGKKWVWNDVRGKCERRVEEDMNIFKKTGNEEFTYELNARAKIFRRDQGKVGDFEAMKSILR